MTFQEIKNSLPQTALREIEGLPFPKIRSGKVREIFGCGEHLLIIATDRLSAFDVILPDGIPGKGVILNQLSLYWFAKTEALARNHLADNHGQAAAEMLKDRPEIIPRAMIVKKLEPLPVEAVVRAYLSGSGWKDYQQTGRLFGQDAPPGLAESARLPAPMFTPTTKAQTGHDEPVSLAQCEEMLGKDVYTEVLRVSFELFRMGSAAAAKAGLILADTKFEFGLDTDKNLYLIDEVLTPDSSRYWPVEDYEPGRSQHAFDKQYVRDYLETLDWDKTPPGPPLPPEVIQNTRQRYLAAAEKIMG